MRTYRALWSTATLTLSALTFVLAGAQLGWWAMVGSAAMLAALGAALGLCWVDDRSRWRLAGECALWFGVAGVLLVGLPTALGDVALLAVLALGGASPPLVHCAVDLWMEHRQARPGTPGGWATATWSDGGGVRRRSCTTRGRLRPWRSGSSVSGSSPSTRWNGATRGSSRSGWSVPGGAAPVPTPSSAWSDGMEGVR